jgi:hypothetical protein
VFTVHPLPVQPDAKFMHFHGGLEARYLGCRLRRSVIRLRPMTKARDRLPGPPSSPRYQRPYRPSLASADDGRLTD